MIADDLKVCGSMIFDGYGIVQNVYRPAYGGVSRDIRLALREDPTCLVFKPIPADLGVVAERIVWLWDAPADELAGVITRRCANLARNKAVNRIAAKTNMEVVF